jgi:hypothetical protein
MNDLDLVREMRADAPSPTRARLAPGRDQLRAAMEGPSRPRHFRRAVLVGGLATVTTVAGVTAAVVTTGTGSPATTSHPAVVPTAKARLTAATQVLDAAAAAAMARASSRPDPHQWIYSRFVQTGGGQATEQDENWMRFDGRQDAYLQNGQLIIHNDRAVPSGGATTPLAAFDANITPLTAYNAIASLDTGPQAVLAAVDQEIATDPSSVEPNSNGSHSSQASEFAYLSMLLWNAYAGAPSAAQGAVFRAMATIPGVLVERDITNAVGHPAIGIGLPEKDGETYLLLDPTTYQVIGQRSTSMKMPLKKEKGGKVTVGSGVISMAWATVALVSSPGQR